VELPLLRKDFIWDAYQIYAGLEAGADAILLIAAILEKSRLEDLQGLAKELGLSVLFEIHDKKECDLAVALKAPMVGVNNRDLRTFKVDVAVSEQLFPHLPESVVKVSESGINSRQVMQRLKKSGANAFLIGESLMTAKRPGEALEELFRRA
jgi:indole-3-glycerol phosphate synthase